MREEVGTYAKQSKDNANNWQTRNEWQRHEQRTRREPKTENAPMTKWKGHGATKWLIKERVIGNRNAHTCGNTDEKLALYKI